MIDRDACDTLFGTQAPVIDAAINLGDVTAATTPCQVYQGGVRRILDALGHTPLIPAKWRVTINAFVQLMDRQCSPTP